MLSVKATYEDGRIHFREEHLPEGRIEVIVTFLKDQPTETRPITDSVENAGRRFVEKWSGVLEGINIDGWNDRKVEDILRKHQ